jgi:hypothetical protein
MNEQNEFDCAFEAMTNEELGEAAGGCACCNPYGIPMMAVPAVPVVPCVGPACPAMPYAPPYAATPYAATPYAGAPYAGMPYSPYGGVGGYGLGTAI